jgi:hypothetical protein
VILVVEDRLGKPRFDLFHRLDCLQGLRFAHRLDDTAVVSIPGPGEGQTRRMPRRHPRSQRGPQKELSLSGSHWRADGAAKTRYPSQREATSAAQLLWAQERVELSVYRCEFCQGWHMGRSSTRD